MIVVTIGQIADSSDLMVAELPQVGDRVLLAVVVKDSVEDLPDHLRLVADVVRIVRIMVAVRGVDLVEQAPSQRGVLHPSQVERQLRELDRRCDAVLVKDLRVRHVADRFFERKQHFVRVAVLLEEVLFQQAVGHVAHVLEAGQCLDEFELLLLRDRLQNVRGDRTREHVDLIVRLLRAELRVFQPAEPAEQRAQLVAGELPELAVRLPFGQRASIGVRIVGDDQVTTVLVRILDGQIQNSGSFLCRGDGLVIVSDDNRQLVTSSGQLKWLITWIWKGDRAEVWIDLLLPLNREHVHALSQSDAFERLGHIRMTDTV